MITRNCRKFFDRILILIHLLVTLFLKVALSTEKFTYFFLLYHLLFVFHSIQCFFWGGFMFTGFFLWLLFAIYMWLLVRWYAHGGKNSYEIYMYIRGRQIF